MGTLGGKGLNNISLLYETTSSKNYTQKTESQLYETTLSSMYTLKGLLDYAIL